MTIEYALTRTEIVLGYFRSLRSSPKHLSIILLYALGMAILTLAMIGAFSRPLMLGDIAAAVASAAGFVVLMSAVLFIRAKTSTRSLTISPEGISTRIGTIQARIPWHKFKVISATDHRILLARMNGNAFFIPNRAFSSSEHKIEFVDNIRRWAKTTQLA